MLFASPVPGTEKTVGAGLLAKAVDQSAYLIPTLRIREQARSHI